MCTKSTHRRWRTAWSFCNGCDKWYLFVLAYLRSQYPFYVIFAVDLSGVNIFLISSSCFLFKHVVSKNKTRIGKTLRNPN